MKMSDLDLYTDYLLSTFGATAATELSAMVDGEVSHDRITRFLSGQDFTSRDLWQQVKPVVRSIENSDGVLIFDDTIQEKAWTDENELMCWHYDHVSGRNVRGINPCLSSRVLALIGLRMMPTFPRPSLKFRTAGFPGYGFKADFSGGAFLLIELLKPAPGIHNAISSLHPPFVSLQTET
jgi:hypothetical protein